MIGRQGKTIRQIREKVSVGVLDETFSPKDVNGALGIHWGGNFLAKHRVGNPSGTTELFVQVSYKPALYRLN